MYVCVWSHIYIYMCVVCVKLQTTWFVCVVCVVGERGVVLLLQCLCGVCVKERSVYMLINIKYF